MILVLATAWHLSSASMIGWSQVSKTESMSVPVAASPPVSRMPLQSYVSVDDYPAGLPRNAAKPVRVSLTVGPEGRVTNCLVTASSGAGQLDGATCRLLRSRTRFEPARDAAGIPISGEVQATIDWAAKPVIRKPSGQGVEGRITLAPWESVSRLRARFGQVAFCEWQKGGVAPPPPSSNACQNSGLARRNYLKLLLILSQKNLN